MESISVFLKRNTIEHTSLLNYYNEALIMYRRYYQYSEIKGIILVIQYERIPETAFREAIANALVHRAWIYQLILKFLCLMIILKLYRLEVYQKD